jgi:DNA invertase Pin-like site-specific DNA recombinase
LHTFSFLDAENVYTDLFTPSNGKRLGRPATAAVKSAEIRKLHRAGISKAEIARRLDIGRTSVRRILADAGSNSAASDKRAGSNPSYVAAD